MDRGPIANEVTSTLLRRMTSQEAVGFSAQFSSSSRSSGTSRRDQPHADHRQPVAVEVARVAHRHAHDLAVVHGAAEGLAAEGGVGAGRRERGVDGVERGVDRGRSRRRRISRGEIEEELGFERPLRRRRRRPLIGLPARIRAGRTPGAARTALRPTSSSAATRAPTGRRRTPPRTARRRRLRGSCARPGFGGAPRRGLTRSRRSSRRARSADRTAPESVEPGCSTLRAKRSAPPAMKASACALAGRISCAAVLPPYSWIAAYLTSPIEPTEARTPSPSVETSAAIESRSAPERDVEDGAHELVVPDAVGERGRELGGLRRERRGERRRQGVEPRARLVEAVEADREHQNATRL